MCAEAASTISSTAIDSATSDIISGIRAPIFFILFTSYVRDTRAAYIDEENKASRAIPQFIEGKRFVLPTLYVTYPA